jgi:DNA-binding HxlR family transcriptional regulator
MQEDYKPSAISVRNALDVFGDHWVLLIMQQVFLGVNTFDGFVQTLGVSRSVLTRRLNKLVDAGCLVKKPYQDNPPRYEYHLTERGQDQYPTALMAMAWEKRFCDLSQPHGVVLKHKSCGHEFVPEMVCGHCDQEVQVRDCSYQRGSGIGQEPAPHSRKRRAMSSQLNVPSKGPVMGEYINIFGDFWTSRVVAAAFFGIRRFNEICEFMGIATNILTSRLELLQSLEIVQRKAYSQNPKRYEYRLTEKGRALFPSIVTLAQWGDKWCTDGEPPEYLLHKPCGETLVPRIVCSSCRQDLHARDVQFVLTGD